MIGVGQGGPGEGDGARERPQSLESSGWGSGERGAVVLFVVVTCVCKNTEMCVCVRCCAGPPGGDVVN